MADTMVAPSPTPAPETSERRKGRRPTGAWFAVGWLVLVVALGFLHPVLGLATPERPQADMIRPDERGISLQHPFGGDKSARDVFSRTILGGKDSILLAVVAIGGATLLGGTAGLLAGFFGKRTDTILSGLMNVMLAMPQLILAMSLVFFLAGPAASESRQFWALALALIVVGTPLIGRITRAATLQYAQREFVTAARALGATPPRLIIREILPNVAPAMASIALLGIAIVIVAEGALALLGLGLKTISWGSILAENQDRLSQFPHAVFFPALFIFLTVMSLNYLGDVVRTKFDIKEIGA